jgi:hypothetical protein
MTAAEQSAELKKTARELRTDESLIAFDRVFERIARQASAAARPKGAQEKSKAKSVRPAASGRSVYSGASTRRTAAHAGDRESDSDEGRDTHAACARGRLAAHYQMQARDVIAHSALPSLSQL